MSKRNVNISIDPYIHDLARKKGFNISREVEQALLKRANPSKADAPEKAIQLKCTECGKEINFGYWCRELDLFLCSKCQDKFKMERCPHDKFREHIHLRVPGLEGQNVDLIDKVPQKA